MNFDFTDKYKKALIAFFLNEFGDAFSDIESELSTLKEFKDELQMKSIEDVTCFSSDASTIQDLRSLDLEEIEANLDVLVNSSLLEDLAPLRDFDLEEIEKRLVILQDQDTRQKEEISALKGENQELRERLLNIENFLLRTMKGFGND